jgi:hypothetical protein
MRCQQHMGDTAADGAAIPEISTAVQELLEPLQDARDPVARAILSAEFVAEIDGVQDGLKRRHDLDDNGVGAVIARSLAHVSAAVRATPQ